VTGSRCNEDACDCLNTSLLHCSKAGGHSANRANTYDRAKPSVNCILDPAVTFNPLNAELNPICCLLALLGAHHFLHVNRIRVKSLTLRLLMSHIYIYGAPILDVSRSHTTTHHSQ